MTRRPDYPPEHRHSYQESYGQESDQPKADYPTLDQQLDHLDTSEFHRHLAYQLTMRLIEELPQEHSIRERTFSGRKLSLQRQDHSGNLWPSQTWLLNEDPHTNAISSLNIQDYHRHLLRSATNKEELNQDYHRIDLSLANRDQLTDTRHSHAAQQAISFYSAATDLLEHQPNASAKQETAAAFAQLVTNPALEAMQTIGHRESLTHPRDTRQAMQEALTHGTLSPEQTALMFQQLQDVLDYAEKVQSLRATDPHTMYTVADRRRDDNQQDYNIHHTGDQSHRSQALNDTIARDLAQYQKQERTPFYGDPTTRHLYDPATVQLLQWAIDHDELDQWAEAPLTHQSETEIRQTVHDIANWTNQTITELSQPPHSLEGPLARWATARGLTSQWLQHYEEHLTSLENQDSHFSQSTQPQGGTDRDWQQRYDQVMNLPHDTPHLAQRQDTVHNILQLRAHARRYPL